MRAAPLERLRTPGLLDDFVRENPFALPEKCSLMPGCSVTRFGGTVYGVQGLTERLGG